MIRKHFLLVVFIFTIILTGCTHASNLPSSEKAEEQVRKLFNQYYKSQLEGNYDDAASLLAFSDKTEDMRDFFPSCFLNTPVQSYTIEDINELTPELYEVHIIGILLAPNTFSYDSNGEISGIVLGEKNHWYINPFNTVKYAAFVDGKWRVCISARYVPEGLYEFSEHDLTGGELLDSINEDTVDIP